MKREMLRFWEETQRYIFDHSPAEITSDFCVCVRLIYKKYVKGEIKCTVLILNIAKFVAR